jgi:HSP20 family protein
MLDQLRRQMDRAFDEYDRTTHATAARNYPASNLYDTGTTYVITAELPGLGQQDVEITATADVVTVSGERKNEVPEGYSVHRSERPSVKFKRSYAMPARIDPEKVSAQLVDGVLTLTLEKAAEVRPRQISVRAH